MPVWFRFSFLVNAPLLFLFPTAVREGGAWWVPAALSFALFCGALVPVVRWERVHRLPRHDGFEIAVERDP
jgi:hypothetical protein